MSYLNGISTTNQLGALPECMQAKLQQNKETIAKVLSRSHLQGLGKTDTLTNFSEVLKRYNPGISEDEIKAWVFYRRTYHKIPMRGWENFFIDDGKVEKELDRMVKAGVLFYFAGKYLPYPVYTYGNMYDREKQLEQDRREIEKLWGSKVYEKHLEAVRSTRPKLISITNPNRKERPKILSISNFAGSFKINQVSDMAGFSIDQPYSLQEAFYRYLYALDRSKFEETSAYNIWWYYIKGSNLPRGLSQEQKSGIKSSARELGEQLFEEFLHEGLPLEERNKLDFAWNRLYNGWSNIQHHKVPIAFNLSSRFKGFDLEIRPAQREGVAFMEMAGSGIIAYDVGVGKTLTAIIELANSLQSGKCKRPVIVVPNPTYQKWIEEIIGKADSNGNIISEGILSGTGIKINDWYNLGTGIKEKIDFSKPVEANSITMLTYEGMKKIGFGESIADELFTELTNILSQSAFSKKRGENAATRDAEIDYQKYRETIGVGLKNTIADIDSMGFDYIVIDEAHRCKNVFDRVKVEKKGDKSHFNISGQVSETGVKAFFLCNYIQRKIGKNVCLLTATPFTNSPLEIYSMLSLVAYERLLDMNIYNINEFFETFVLPTMEYVANYKGEIEEKEVIKAFNNRLVLQKLIYNNINYKTGEEAGVKRPCKVNLPKVNKIEDGVVRRLSPEKQILTYLSPTDRQRVNQLEIISRAQRATEGRLDMRELLRSLNYSLDNALSPFLYEKGTPPEDFREFVTESPKINYVMQCIASVKQHHDKKKQPLSGQVIYMNRGKQFFPMIKQYLEDVVGYKQKVDFIKNGRNTKIDEVEILDSSVSMIKKENIKEAFLSGECKVIIGTATIREGIDLQKNGTAIYNCYPEWNPTDVRQLEGRVWRQGNRFGYVRVVMPLVQDSMDVFVFQKLEEKSQRINDIWYKSDRGNVLDLESLDPAEVKFALITNLEQLAKMQLDKETKQVKVKLQKARYDIELLEEYKKNLSLHSQYKEKILKELRYWSGVIRDYEYVNQKMDAKALRRYFKEEHASRLSQMSEVEQKKMLDQTITLAEKDQQLFEEMEGFLALSTYQDKELIAIAGKLSRAKSGFSTYELGVFKEYVKKNARAEKTILEPFGLSPGDELDKAFSQIEKNKQTAEKEMEHIKSSRYVNQVMEQIEKKKKELAITGRTVDQRAQEFSKLNYLLDYAGQGYPESCELDPASGHKPVEPKEKNDDFSFTLALKRKRAKAKLLLAA